MKLVNLISMQTIARANEEVSNVREKERGDGLFLLSFVTRKDSLVKIIG